MSMNTDIPLEKPFLLAHNGSDMVSLSPSPSPGRSLDHQVCLSLCHHLQNHAVFCMLVTLLI
ncbi:unnamed protein product [Arabidopsis lyrata]|nr:unnamed protein product [Arabidopsis lyrata]